LVIHPGSYRGQTLNRALRVLSGSVAGAVRGVRWNGLELLLENTAGGGMSIGRDFDELAELRSAIERKAAISIRFCIDTAHCYQAGFDLSTAEGLETTLQRIERSIGLDGVCVLHANDSKTALGSRHDRHANIGLGRLGREAFRRMLRDPRLRGKPFILETPAGEDGTHRRDVATLKALARRRTLQN
jgi:apurinic endonuclease APN1